MAGSPHPGVVLRPPAPVHHVWVVQPGDHARLARDVVALHVFTKGMAALVALATALVVLCVLTSTPPGVAGPIVALVVTITVFPLLLLRETKRMLAAVTAPGALWALGFGPSALTVHSPVDTSTIDYVALSPPRQRGSAIKVPYRAKPAASSLVPSQLCPPEALHYLIAQIRL